MSDPLALLPLAVAAHGGRVDAHEAQQLVAAGLTLLRRTVPLVRALSGARAAILLPPTPAYLVALAASEGRGAVLVNPLAAPPEIAHQLADANVGAVFTVAALEHAIPPAIPRVLLDEAPARALYVHGGERRTVDLGSHVGLSLEGEVDVPGREEEAVIVYTSAMAGTPLGAILTHRNILANARAAVAATGTTAADHALALLPIAHLFGFTITLVAPLLAGARVSTMARFDPARVLRVVEESRITMLVGVPAMYRAMLGALALRGGRLRAPALRLCICGGAPLDPALQEQWLDATGVDLRQGYGLTEAGPGCLFNVVSRPNRIGSLGVPFPGVSVTIRDESGAEVARGAEGEICVAGESVFAGYVSGGDAGLQRNNEWLRTGDLGAMDDDGAVTFRGVRKAMFTRNGFNIYPREIERAVRELPGVLRATVRTRPTGHLEHDIVLDVTGTVSAADVARWCRARLAAYKQPAEVYVSSA